MLWYGFELYIKFFNLSMKIFFILSLLNFLEQIYYEISSKNYFSDRFAIIKSESIAWNRINNKENYSLLDICFDFIYLLKIFPKFSFYHFRLTFFFILLFKILKYFPICFIILFNFFLIRFILMLIWAVISGVELEIVYVPIQPCKKITVFSLIKQIFFTSKHWAHIVLYSFLSLKKKKLTLKFFENIAVSFIFGKPL